LGLRLLREVGICCASLLPYIAPGADIFFLIYLGPRTLTRAPRPRKLYDSLKRSSGSLLPFFFLLLSLDPEAFDSGFCFRFGRRSVKNQQTFSGNASSLLELSSPSSNLSHLLVPIYLRYESIPPRLSPEEFATFSIFLSQDSPSLVYCLRCPSRDCPLSCSFKNSELIDIHSLSSLGVF